MKILAVGRHLLIRTDYDLIDDMMKKSVIAFTQETLDRLKGGFQVSTILSVGEAAFDDEPPNTQELMRRSKRQIITSRYPGCEIDFDPLASDGDVLKYRMILSDEVRGAIAFKDEDGIEVTRGD